MYRTAMKTTLVLDDSVADRLRASARERAVSMSSVVEEALIRFFTDEHTFRARPHVELPSFPLGRPAVDVADRNALHDFMDAL